MTLEQLLAERSIKRALVVDDACDEIPRAVDLAGRAGEWATFAADMLPEQRDLLRGESPETAELTFDEQIADDRYVAAVWRVRVQLDGLADPVFEAYEAQRESDLEYVRLAQDRLKELGLECESIGREFQDAAQDVDLIVIDLYFGGAQNEAAFEESKHLLAKAVERRRDNPPLVLLMSRSERIFDRRDNFRDEVRLVDSGFRILLKPDLRTAGRLDRQLERLAESLPDTLKLARFFASLEGGISDAAERTLSVMRRLKLSDIAQIQQLLLDVEGEPAGSYLVDVFDRVLQHEIERDSSIIKAAIDVNDLTGARHPPPYAAGSPQLQEVVERTLTQNRERLKLPGSVDSPVTFGDILQLVPPAPVEGAAEAESSLPFELESDDILVVLTPICDLQRRLAPQLLMMVGKVKEIDRTQWSYGPDARTPAIDFGVELKWIKWNLKHILTISWAQLEQALGGGTLKIVARLREAHALEIQQRLLAGLGRVGLVAPMPATFAVTLEAYVTTPEGGLHRLVIAELADEAVVWVGRDENGNPFPRLVLTERACDGIQDALAAVEPANIVAAAQPALEHIQSTGEFARELESGLDITGLQSGNWLKVPAPGGGQQLPHMALVALNGPPDLPGNMCRKAGVMLVIREAERELGTPSLEDFIEPSIPDQPGAGSAAESAEEPPPGEASKPPAA